MQAEPQPTSIISTRVQPPSGGGRLIERTRLIDLLREGRRKRLTVIHAPAGYGKTTLALQWQRELRADGVPVAWLSAADDDNDPVIFLAHLVVALQRVEPALGADLGEQLEQRSGGATRYVLAELVNHLQAYGRPLAVVIDDWHLVDSADTAAALDFLLRMAPDNLHLIVTSRTRAPAIGWLRVRDLVTEIDVTQLRFDADESAAFLTELNALVLGSDDVDRLFSSTDGWVAALQLATLSLRRSNDPSALIAGFSGRHHSVGDYLAENVLDGLPPHLLDFLLRTSVCDRLCADLATALTGEPQGQAVLEELERRDLFLRPMDADREWFRYHHLFADYLRQRLQRDRGDLVVPLHRTASAWFAGQGMLTAAVSHALAAGDSGTAVDLVEHQAMNLVEHSRMASLLALVSKLPERELTARPALQMAIAWANCLLQRGTGAQTALDHVRTALGAAEDETSAAVLGEADIVQACVDVYGDRIDRAADLVAPYLVENAPVRPFLVAVSANIRTFVDIQTHDFATAQARQQWANAYHQRAGGPFAGVYGRCFAGLAAFAQVDLDTAERRVREARELAQNAAGAHSHAARLAGALLGKLAYERGDIDTAETLLEECHELGAESGVADFMVATYTTLPRIRVLRGDLDGAFALLDEGSDAARRLVLPRLAAALDYERVRLYLAVDDLTRAEDTLARHSTGGPTSSDGIATATHHYRLCMAERIACARNDFDKAAAIIRTMRAEAAAVRWRYAETVHTIGLARVSMLRDDVDGATDLLVQALVTGARAGLVRTIVDNGPEVQKLIAGLREATRTGRWVDAHPRVSADYLSKLLAVAHADRGTLRVVLPPVQHGPSPEEPLSVREIEILRLLERGLSNKQIARTLGVTINTVKWYLKGTYIKLGVASRGESVSEARRRRILS
ncbi:ATP/maltotriose-dependent transcriptional regulator MalT [Mycolicibacterium iranicum]|uniref:ATP/maltotriose-dependent transcriptional regulator MalT n=1 Tax=Mycolicibacterium iranicum TaxID=912594 RepID=A0A839Q1M7_MYCIR|nr:LuxR C-terminal-related transcriptional regulator [Mycolicibacterium iranicum]MBB2990060.1 ATP/maltotriose-dependent transcriptional regulator MalT [Mycolicibacterium iranicum]